MAIIPHAQSPLSRAIDAWQEESAERRDHYPTLRCSEFGGPCQRALWYQFRWAHEPQKFPARILRIFDNGKARELAIIAYLRGAGVHVVDADPETGEQLRFSLAEGFLTGSCDGVAMRVPEAPATAHILEIKTMNDKRWTAWRRKGVCISDRKYWTQMQLYMHAAPAARALLVCENQDTKEIECERIEADHVAASNMVNRAERLARAEEPPEKINADPAWYECRSCAAHGACHKGEWPRRNCRTCIAAKPVNGETWHCERHKRDMNRADQISGCELHLYLPSLVAGEVIDADFDAARITYRMADGSEFIDGQEPAIAPAPPAPIVGGSQ